MTMASFPSLSHAFVAKDDVHMTKDASHMDISLVSKDLHRTKQGSHLTKNMLVILVHWMNFVMPILWLVMLRSLANH